MPLLTMLGACYIGTTIAGHWMHAKREGKATDPAIFAVCSHKHNVAA